MKTAHSYKTRLKRQILAAFTEREDGLLSATEIYDALREGGTTLNLTTVYRNLDAMTRDGILLRFSDEAGRATYKYAGADGGCREHLHAQCTVCGEVVHLDCSFVEQLRAHTSSEHSFHLSTQRSMLYGECDKCRREREMK